MEGVWEEGRYGGRWGREKGRGDEREGECVEGWGREGGRWGTEGGR